MELRGAKTRNSANTTLALGSLGAQLSSAASGTTASHTSSSAMPYWPSPRIVTATLPDPLNANDATTWACEQPRAFGGCGTVTSVALSVGVLGLIAVPLAMGTTITENHCIAAAPTVTSSGADQFAQCRVAVTLSDVLGDIDAVLFTVDGMNASVVAVSLRDEAEPPTLPEPLMEGVRSVARSIEIDVVFFTVDGVSEGDKLPLVHRLP
jgi:hypothetical protein